MNNKELVKGIPCTYWEIIRYFDDNKKVNEELKGVDLKF